METLNSNTDRGGCKRVWLVVAMLAVNARGSALMVEWRTPDVVTFDMKGTIDRFMDQSSRKNPDEANSRALTDRFTTSMNSSIKDWQVSCHALILVSPAVVSGARDITHEVHRT